MLFRSIKYSCINETLAPPLMEIQRHSAMREVKCTLPHLHNYVECRGDVFTLLRLEVRVNIPGLAAPLNSMNADSLSLGIITCNSCK